jgi:hypothetical protein
MTTVKGVAEYLSVLPLESCSVEELDRVFKAMSQIVRRRTMKWVILSS